MIEKTHIKKTGANTVGTLKITAPLGKIIPSGTETNYINPLDELIRQCYDIQETLLRSNLLLNKYSQELDQISADMDRFEYLRDGEDTTDYYSTSGGESVLDHQMLFDDCLEENNWSEDVRSNDSYLIEDLKPSTQTSLKYGSLSERRCLKSTGRTFGSLAMVISNESPFRR